MIKEKCITENQKCLIVSLSIVEICLALGGFIRNVDQDFLKIFVFTTPGIDGNVYNDFAYFRQIFSCISKH